MLTHLNGSKIRVVSAKNNKTSKISCDLFKNRNTSNLNSFTITLKKIIILLPIDGTPIFF